MAQVLSYEDDTAVSFASKLAASESFKSLFREGMALVEETAGYLDGDGRDEAKSLPRLAALAYATESMRLTTRLMQVASWLLVQRAVREGDMAPESALDASYRLGAEADADGAAAAEKLPTPLCELLGRSERLFERVKHLDSRMYADGALEAAAGPHPVLAQMERLKDAFGA
jgi:regulator of CtrA degradation